MERLSCCVKRYGLQVGTEISFWAFLISACVYNPDYIRHWTGMSPGVPPAVFCVIMIAGLYWMSKKVKDISTGFIMRPVFGAMAMMMVMSFALLHYDTRVLPYDQIGMAIVILVGTACGSVFLTLTVKGTRDFVQFAKTC